MLADVGRSLKSRFASSYGRLRPTAHLDSYGNRLPGRRTIGMLAVRALFQCAGPVDLLMHDQLVGPFLQLNGECRFRPIADQRPLDENRSGSACKAGWTLGGKLGDFAADERRRIRQLCRDGDSCLRSRQGVIRSVDPGPVAGTLTRVA